MRRELLNLDVDDLEHDDDMVIEDGSVDLEDLTS